MTAYLFTTWLTEYCSPLLRSAVYENKIFLKRFLHNDNVSGYPRVLMETDSEINVVFMPINTTWIKN